jgi:L-ascorbate metabolism protein UlaG (beta-lactamase superfamily)
VKEPSKTSFNSPLANNAAATEAIKNSNLKIVLSLWRGQGRSLHNEARTRLEVSMFRRIASWLFGIVFLVPAYALAAGCEPNIALQPQPRLMLASYTLVDAVEGSVDLTFIGHASVLLKSPQGVTAVTDLNDYFPPPFPPDIATMNHFHDTHYTNHPDPRIPNVLRGWDTGNGPAHWDLTVKDVRVRNIPTNVRNFFTGGTEFNGNSIFIFEIADLCVAHLSHLQHTLAPEHLAAMGQIDVLLPMVDGAYSLSQYDIIEVIDQIKPQLIIPIHYFAQSQLQNFLDRMQNRFPIEHAEDPHIVLSRSTLPKRPEILVLPAMQQEFFRFAPPSRN